jgi:hypothetical protein
MISSCYYGTNEYRLSYQLDDDAQRIKSRNNRNAKQYCNCRENTIAARTSTWSWVLWVEIKYHWAARRELFLFHQGCQTQPVYKPKFVIQNTTFNILWDIYKHLVTWLMFSNYLELYGHQECHSYRATGETKKRSMFASALDISWWRFWSVTLTNGCPMGLPPFHQLYNWYPLFNF